MTSHTIRAALVSTILVFAFVGCPASDPSQPIPVTATGGPAVAAVPHYATNTSDATRDVHRQAIAHLRAGELAQACDVLGGVEQSDRRALTEYLTLLCETRLPDRALSADDAAVRATSVDVEPSLMDAQRDALDRHRAWIAAIQDSLADAAKAEFQLSGRPLPPALQNSTALSAISAWRTRGTRFHAPTYTQAFQAMQSPDIATTLARRTLLASLSAQTANQVLFADVTGMTLPARPALALPTDSDL